MSNDCFQMYKAFVRPGIESLLQNYFRDWQDIERILFMMVLKHNRVYKTSMMIFQIDEDGEEKWSNEIDVKKYKDFRSKGVFWHINHLHKEQVIGEETCHLLHEARLRRNKVHSFNYVIPEKDRVLFSRVYGIIHSLFLPMSIEGLDPVTEGVREKAELWSKEILDRLEQDSI